MRRLAAEFAGTFALVLVGCGSIVAVRAAGGALPDLCVPVAFGLVVAAMVLLLGPVSGAHINPAVTAALWAAGRFPGRSVAPYVAGQAAGAVAASLVLLAVAGEAGGNLGATLPAVATGTALLLEIGMTWALMLVVLWAPGGLPVAAGAGLVVGFSALIFGPLTGASLNPARSLGPAVAALEPTTLWIYLVAPTAGALLAVPTCRALRGRACCARGPAAACAGGTK
jgi:glycerol uptake facilitator-like aquaporin